ncbi:MAG: hypothetical protein KC503_16615 [Myxococcales bacterium]|nr:hypothetical protein [Myxococcales bacterium]
MSRAEFSSARARELAERAVSGELSRDERASLARALDEREADREAFDALSMAMCQLERREDGLCGAAQERILDQLLAGLQPTADAAAEPGAREGFFERWLVALASAAAALLVALGLYYGRTPVARPDRPRFQTRGLTSHADGGRYGLGIHCVRAGRVLDAPARDDALSPDARCRADDELQLTLTHVAPRAGRRYPYLLVLGFADKGAPRRLYYYPVPPTGRSGAAPVGQRGEALGEARRLAVNHRPGRVRLVAFFSKQPLDASAAHRWLAQLGWQERADERAALLGPAGDIVVVSRRLQITPIKEAPR